MWNIIVDGGWGPWNTVGLCSKPCFGTMTSVRLCDSPAPKNGGQHCKGEPYEKRTCHLLPEASCLPGNYQSLGDNQAK